VYTHTPSTNPEQSIYVMSMHQGLASALNNETKTRRQQADVGTATKLASACRSPVASFTQIMRRAPQGCAITCKGRRRLVKLRRAAPNDKGRNMYIVPPECSRQAGYTFASWVPQGWVTCSLTNTSTCRHRISRSRIFDQITTCRFLTHAPVGFLFLPCSGRFTSLNTADCMAHLCPLQNPGLTCNPTVSVIALHVKVWGIV
jgi:hypothetical protein